MKNRDEMGSWRVKAESEWKDKNDKGWKMKRKDRIYFRLEIKKQKDMRRKERIYLWKEKVNMENLYFKISW